MAFACGGNCGFTTGNASANNGDVLFLYGGIQIQQIFAIDLRINHTTANLPAHVVTDTSLITADTVPNFIPAPCQHFFR
ncbi:hypothetical protein D3C73_1029400 [compost metagenome]